MGREWDSFSPAGFQAWCEKWAAECLRILRPGGHLLAFGGTRTYHRLVCGIEDAGFEVRDSLHWIYGSGFPKSLDVSKAIDKRPGVSLHREFAEHLAQRRTEVGLSRADVSERVVGTRTGACWNWEHHQFPEARWWPALRDLLGLDATWGDVIAEAEREIVGKRTTGIGTGRGAVAVIADGENRDVTAPATGEAQRWDGWGTALKPAHEPIVLARKPLAGTVAGNVLEHGTGALNVDGCRVVHATAADLAVSQAKNPGRGDTATSAVYGAGRPQQSVNAAGRWPPNILLTHAAGCQLLGTRQVRGGMASPNSGAIGSGHIYRKAAARPDGDFGGGYTGPDGTETVEAWNCAPGCPVAELDRQSGTGTNTRHMSYKRNGGEFIDGIPSQPEKDWFVSETGGASRFFPIFRYEAKAAARERPRGEDGTAHPTVKPADLMGWLVRLVTPPGGLVLDPFAGSGTTAEACIVEGFRCTLIEKDPAYVELIRTRLRRDIQPGLFGYTGS